MAKAGKKKLEHEVEELTKDNEKLRVENRHLQDELSHHAFHKRPSFWRNVAISLCIVLACLFLMVGNVLSWAGNTLVNSDRYIETVQPILEDSAVQAALADYTTAKLFSQVDVTGIIQNALPPKASFLAPALTSQVRNATDKTLQKVLASSKFQVVWLNTNRAAHDKLINSIKNSKGDGVVNLQDVYDTLSQTLKDTKLSFLADKALPANVGTITIINAPWIPKARFVVNSVGWLKPLTLSLVAIFGATAIWLSRRRRTTVMVIAASIGASMLVTLLGVHFVERSFAAKAPVIYRTAADHAAGIVMHHLLVQTIAILCAAVVIGVIAWVTGPHKYALELRRLIATQFTEPTHRLLWHKETAATHWLSERKTIFEWAIVAVFALNGLLHEISPKAVISRTIFILIAVLIVEIIASPRIPKDA